MTVLLGFGILLAISFVTTISVELYRGLRAESK